MIRQSIFIRLDKVITLNSLLIPLKLINKFVPLFPKDEDKSILFHEHKSKSFKPIQTVEGNKEVKIFILKEKYLKSENLPSEIQDFIKENNIKSEEFQYKIGYDSLTFSDLNR